MVDEDTENIILLLNNIELNDNTAKSYLQETTECLKNNCYRSAILMSWSVLMFIIYKEIEAWNLQEFIHRMIKKWKIPTINNIYDLNKIDDSQIIQMCHEIGFYDQNIKNKLSDHAKTRNSCAHVSQDYISKFTVLEFINDICNYISIIQSLNEKEALTILQSIKNMEISKIEEKVRLMSFKKLIILIEKLLDRISTITEHKEYLESTNLYETIKISFDSRKDESERSVIFEKVINAICTENWYVNDLINEIFKWCEFSYINEYVLNKGYLDKIIEFFADSGTYEIAKNRSKILLKFQDKLTSSHMNNIVSAILSNSQINESYGAKTNLKNLLKKSNLSTNIIDSLKEKNLFK